jgi:hypothetical protein
MPARQAADDFAIAERALARLEQLAKSFQAELGHVDDPALKAAIATSVLAIGELARPLKVFLRHNEIGWAC